MMWNRIRAGFIRQARLTVVLAAITLFVGTGLSYLNNETVVGPEAKVTEAGATPASAPMAWGGEVLAGLSGRVLAGLPIRVANACGLGASSCFRCHNGKRAAEPAQDPVADPWHVQHSKVNYSCAGCHQGNPRLMKQTMAHRGLVSNPVSEPEKTCFGCHTSADAQGLVDTYRKLTNTKGE